MNNTMDETIPAELRRKVTDLVAGGEALTDAEFCEHLTELISRSKATTVGGAS